MSKLTIRKGKTFTHLLRYGVEPFIYKAITEIQQSAPVRIKAVGHGLVNGWPVAVVSAGGMTQLNAENDPPEPPEFQQATVVDADYIELNRVNASRFKLYTSGGYLQFYTPIDLAGGTARMVVKTKVDGDTIASSVAAHITDGALPIAAALDNVLKTILFLFTDEVTGAITNKAAVFECEFEDSAGAVHYLDSGTIDFTAEVAK